MPPHNLHFFDNAERFVEAFQGSLSQIIGSKLEDYWLSWDIEADEWNNDMPVILKIAGTQFEFTVRNLDELSLTFGQIDLSKKIDWYGSGDEFPLEWRNKSNEAVNKLIGRKIKNINIITYDFSSTIVHKKGGSQRSRPKPAPYFMLNGIEFEFEKNGWFDNENFLQIFNALDENGLTTKKLKEGKEYRKIKIYRKPFKTKLAPTGFYF